jgi:hypothetical protein
MREEPIDVKFYEVKAKASKSAWWNDPDLIEIMMRLICGSMLWAMAAYSFHLFLINNF